ncbi:DUF2264 domain-containing protein [Streptomyces atratus]|uniref:DUF2264 domain-containing protein n=1 Tax=Streptomyces atratus TaxID=1893 RepID=UPI0033FE17C4
MCAAGAAAGLARDRAWAALSPQAQQQVIEWMSGAFDIQIPDNNWYWFRIAVGEFLASVGTPLTDDQCDQLERERSRLEEFRVGDGWYRDGPHVTFDHYCGWAMHTCPVLVDLITGPHEGTVPAHERLRRYLEDASYLVGADGSPIFQGHSLIYRFAARGPVGRCPRRMHTTHAWADPAVGERDASSLRSWHRAGLALGGAVTRRGWIRR